MARDLSTAVGLTKLTHQPQRETECIVVSSVERLSPRWTTSEDTNASTVGTDPSSVSSVERVLLSRVI